MSAGLGSMAALDLRRAAYIRRYPDSTQLKMYAHRRRKSLLVVEVSKLAEVSGGVEDKKKIGNRRRFRKRTF